MELFGDSLLPLCSVHLYASYIIFKPGLDKPQVTLQPRISNLAPGLDCGRCLSPCSVPLPRVPGQRCYCQQLRPWLCGLLERDAALTLWTEGIALTLLTLEGELVPSSGGRGCDKQSLLALRASPACFHGPTAGKRLKVLQA